MGSMQYYPADADSQLFFGISSPLDHSQRLHHPVHGLAHGTQSLFILGRTFGHPVLRPEGPAKVGTERAAADRDHLADDIEVVDGLQCYLLAAHPVAAYCQGCTHFVAQDVGVLCHHGPAAVQHGLGLGAQVALIHRGADDDTVRPIPGRRRTRACRLCGCSRLRSRMQ